MSRAEFTPGAWKVNGSDQTTAIWVEDSDGKRVCTLRNCDTDLDRANLIAAAPDLLYALRGIIEGTSPNWIDVARAAIIKAEGE